VLTTTAIMSHEPPSLPRLPPRVRSQPHRLAHEQEDERLQAAELAQLLHAMRLSFQHDSDDTQSDSSESDESDAEEGEDADEESLAASLSLKEREEYDELLEDEEKAGWSTSHSPITVHPFNAPPAAPIPLLNGCTTPLDFLYVLLPLTFFDFMTDHINAYADNRRTADKENVPPARSTRAQIAGDEYQPWKPTTTAEVLAFVGCILCMGLVDIRNTRDYWSDDLGLPFVNRTFPRDRFLQLLRYFHLSDPVNPRTAGDRIYKVRHLNDLIIKQSQAAHYPSQHLTVDEAMVAFKGRSKLKQHIPSKTSDTGIKVWMLVECSTGYVFNFEIYEGKGEEGPETGQSQRVVNHLVKPLDEQRWHVICADGFFSSVELYDSLHQRGFYAVGTTRNWLTGFPKSLLFTNTKLKSGQSLFRQRGDLVCVSWMDQKPVNLLSTYCDPLIKSSVQRWRRSSRTGRRDKRVTLQCPHVVVEYHKWMRGVDVFSQRESYSRIGRKSKRPWPRLAWFLIDIGISNAYVLYRQYVSTLQTVNSAGETPKAFRRALMQQLVGTFTARRKRGRPWSSAKIAENEPQHIPRLRMAQRPCVVCSSQHSTTRGGHKPRTTEGCETCGIAVHIACWKRHLSHESEGEEEEMF
jgi:hypothetical protein